LATSKSKSFLVLFFKKELLSFALGFPAKANARALLIMPATAGLETLVPPHIDQCST
jgi:hypothetical protein